MSGVYNRKLFRQSNSRNSFQGMGGIMSSSNELMQQAMQTANNAPMPSDLGPLQLQPQAAMPQPEAIPYDPSQAGMLPPDQGMPAEPAPPDPMGQMQGQAPMDPMQQQPMGAPPEQAPPQELAPMQDAPFMPPGPPPSVAGYQDGGSVLGRFGRAPGAMADPASRMLQGSQGGESFFSGFLDRFKTTPEQLALEKKRFDAVDPVDMALLQAGGAGGFFPNLSSDPMITAAADVSSGPIDIGVTAGTVDTTQLTGLEMFNIAEQILPSLGVLPPETVATNIVTEAEKNGVPFSGDLRADIESLYSELTGDPEATNKSIDDLNRGILGAAIAAGKSPRATENIANGMLVGLQAMKDTEEKRAAVAAQAQYGLLTAALAPKTATSGNTGVSDRPPAMRAYLEAKKSIMDQDRFALGLPAGVSKEQYAVQYAEKTVAESFLPEELVGTPFEGIHEKLGAPPPAAGTTPPPAADAPPPAALSAEEKKRMLEEARDAINNLNVDPDAVKERLKSMGIDPGEL